MKIKEALTGEEKWCQNTAARNAIGESVRWDSVSATSWCLSEWAKICYPVGSGRVHRRLAGRAGVAFISQWNDKPTTTFEDVKRLVEALDV